MNYLFSIIIVASPSFSFHLPNKIPLIRNLVNHNGETEFCFLVNKRENFVSWPNDLCYWSVKKEELALCLNCKEHYLVIFEDLRWNSDQLYYRANFEVRLEYNWRTAGGLMHMVLLYFEEKKVRFKVCSLTTLIYVTWTREERKIKAKHTISLQPLMEIIGNMCSQYYLFTLLSTCRWLIESGSRN